MSDKLDCTRRLSEYARSVNYDTFSDDLKAIVRMCLQDFIGVAVAGSQKNESEIWRQYYKTKVTAPEASLFQNGFPRMTMEQSAALNAVYGHVMDLDDVHNASIAHLAVITIPTAMAMAQKLHLSGSKVMEAVTAGYEVGARIGETINPSSYKYWHTTGVVGVFSAAATAAKLLDLNEEQFLNCLGTAGTQAAGLWEFLDSGSMSKVMHTAHANLCGIRSAELAKLGFTGAPTILEGERGFVGAVAPKYDLSHLTEGYGQGYRIAENSFKPYACCRHIHSANYCIEQILEMKDLKPEDIVSIVDETYSTAVQHTNNPYPENSYAAKFSTQFCIAAAICLRDLSDRTFTPDKINDPVIKSLMSRIEVKLSPELDQEFKKDPTRWPHRITIELKDGERVTKQIDFPLGDPKNPFDQAAIDRKFKLITKDVLGDETATEFLNRLHHIDEYRDVNEIFNIG